MNTEYSMSIKSREDFDNSPGYFEKKIKKINEKVGWRGPSCNINDKVMKILNDKDNPMFFLQLEKSDKEIFAGYIVAKYQTDENKGLQVCYLAIHPSYSGQGLGTELMKKIFKLAREKNIVVFLKHADVTQLYKFYGRFKPIVTDSSNCLDFLFEEEDLVKPIFDPAISLQAIEENYKPEKSSCTLL